jgi:hypothetical protein
MPSARRFPPPWSVEETDPKLEAYFEGVERETLWDQAPIFPTHTPRSGLFYFDLK